MESQCVGLAESLGLAPVIKRVRMRGPWRLLSPHMRLALSRAFEDETSLVPPWPDLLIASGRLSVAASLYVRKESCRTAKRTFTIQIQDPVISPSNFDLVIAPVHDALRGPNVITTIGALHRVETNRLAAEAKLLAQRIRALHPPYIGVLLGGSNSSYRFGANEAAALACALHKLAYLMKASLLVTPSRRTGNEPLLALKAELRDAPAFVWDGTGDNPYFGILGLSDYLVVTVDSVNMISEACASGKPVYLYGLPGGSRKSTRFREALLGRGLVRDFHVPLEPYRSQPLNEMAEVVAAIERKTAA